MRFRGPGGGWGEERGKGLKINEERGKGLKIHDYVVLYIRMEYSLQIISKLLCK